MAGSVSLCLDPDVSREMRLYLQLIGAARASPGICQDPSPGCNGPSPGQRLTDVTLAREISQLSDVCTRSVLRSDHSTPKLTSHRSTWSTALGLIAHSSVWLVSDNGWDWDGNLFPPLTHILSPVVSQSQVPGSGVSRLSVRCYVSVSSWGPYVMSSVQCSPCLIIISLSQIEVASLLTFS